MKKSILEILETDTAAAHKLKLLMRYEGWKLLVDILTKNELDPLADDLRTKEYETIEKRNRDKDKLNNLEKVLNAPSFYASALAESPDGAPPSPDPYAQNIKEAEEINKADH